MQQPVKNPCSAKIIDATSSAGFVVYRLISKICERVHQVRM